MQLGKVESTGNNVGGLVGYSHSYNKTNSSYAHYNYCKVEDSFATGEVIGGENVGGLVRIWI